MSLEDGGDDWRLFEALDRALANRHLNVNYSMRDLDQSVANRSSSSTSKSMPIRLQTS